MTRSSSETMTRPYDVAISYASEDIEVADAIAYRLRQDGFRCFFNAVRLHKLLGLPLPEGLDRIFGHPQVIVVILLSESYWKKEYPVREYNAATARGVDKIILIRIGDVAIPAVFQDTSFATHQPGEEQALATMVSNAIADRLHRPEALSFVENESFEEKTILPLDNPARPYEMSDVEFYDTGEVYTVDVFSDRMEHASALQYITRIDPSRARVEGWADVTFDQIRLAKQQVRDLVNRKAESGWTIFNGRKYGVARLQRTRAPETEHHRLIVQVYETDYYTSQFAKRLYWLLNAGTPFTPNLNRDLAPYSGLLASFGFDILLIAPKNAQPKVLLAQRSENVANSAETGGAWHVSMNEGVSKNDRSAAEFDSSATIFRGFAEELNLPRVQIERIELYEPFLELNNFELGICGVAYTTIDLDRIRRTAAHAPDARLEFDGWQELDANATAVRRLLADPGVRCTNLLRFGLQSALFHRIIAGT